MSSGFREFLTNYNVAKSIGAWIILTVDGHWLASNYRHPEERTAWQMNLATFEIDGSEQGYEFIMALAHHKIKPEEICHEEE